MDGNYPLGLAMLGQALAESGRHDEGIQLLRSAAAADGARRLLVEGPARTLTSPGKVTSSARGRFSTNSSRDTNRPRADRRDGGDLRRLGRRRSRAGVAEKAAEQPGALWFWIPIDPLWARLRAQPRFRTILTHWRR
jgi:hypothetical protein